MSACPVCDGVSHRFATGLVLGRHHADYLRCARCGSVHVAEPYWLEEAYSCAIAPSDIGLPLRAVQLSAVVPLVVRRYLPTARRFLDYGAGNGLLVRMLRDRGFDFRWFDPHAANQFAAGHEGSLDERFDLITAFEVLEHLRQPSTELEPVFAASPALLSSTLLLPHPTPEPDAWWYYARDTGQHICFYTEAGLRILAADHGRAVTCSPSMQLFGPRSWNRRLFRLLTSATVATWLRPLTGRPSLLDADYEQEVRRAGRS